MKDESCWLKDTDALLGKLTKVQTLTDGVTVSDILLEVDIVWLIEFDSETMLVEEDAVENRDWDLL